MDSITKLKRQKTKYSFHTTCEIELSRNASLVKTNKDFKNFFYLPWDIYKNDSNWVPPFWIEYTNFFDKHNPFWNHAESALFMVKRNNKIVGRIAAIIDYLYCKTMNQNIGFFGFFECINDTYYATELFNNAEHWLSMKGMKTMQGPINGRIDNGCGFLQDGFDIQPSILSSYSPKYYLSLVKNYDMKKSKDQITYMIDLRKPIPQILRKKSKDCIDSGIRLRHFNRLRANKELEWWIPLFLETFSDHWGYVPVSPEEVRTRFGIKQLRWIVDPDLFLIAEMNKRPIAYIWATPDYNQLFKSMNGKFGIFQILNLLRNKKNIDHGKLHFIGIKENMRQNNIASLLNYTSLFEMKKRGYKLAEVGWIDEKNVTAHKTIKLTGAQLYKKYRVFEKTISS